MSDTASNYVAFTVPDGSVIVNPTVKSGDNQELIQWVFDGTFENLRIGYADGDPNNYYLRNINFYQSAGGTFTISFKDERTFNVGRDEVLYGNVILDPTGFIKMSGVQVLGTQQPAIDDSDPASGLNGVSDTLNTLLAAVRAHGLIAS